jgi:hypothetical protein
MTPLSDRKIMEPASVSISRIQGAGMVVPLCRLVSVAMKPFSVVRTPAERLPTQYSTCITTLVADDIETVKRRLKEELAGEISVSGPELAGSLTELGLIDEYRL